jgi:hypothetical protein
MSCYGKIGDGAFAPSFQIEGFEIKVKRRESEPQNVTFINSRSH